MSENQPRAQEPAKEHTKDEQKTHQHVPGVVQVDLHKVHNPGFGHGPVVFPGNGPAGLRLNGHGPRVGGVKQDLKFDFEHAPKLGGASEKSEAADSAEQSATPENKGN